MLALVAAECCVACLFKLLLLQGQPVPCGEHAAAPGPQPKLPGCVTNQGAGALAVQLFEGSSTCAASPQASFFHGGQA